jgi:photosystem II stability/assembly factor-like uncharacterized protein
MTAAAALFFLSPVTAAIGSAAATEAAEQRLAALSYRNVGPTRGGRVTAVAGTVAAANTFYLGASGGGIWKSTDYGTSWRNVSDGYFASPSAGAISVSQRDPNFIVVGTGSDGLRSNVISGKGVYRSLNGGESWQHMGLTNTGHIGAVEIDPRSDSVIWVAAIGQAFSDNEERGVYRSGDGGNSWQKVLYVSEQVGFSDLELLPHNPDVILATAWRAQRRPWTIVSGGGQSEGGLYKSEDGGESWRRIREGLPGGLIGKMDIAVSPADSSVVYLLVEAPGDEGGLYRSDDQGESFRLVSNRDGLRTRPFYYGNVVADPQDADTVYVMATDYFRSRDGGESWEELDPPHGDNHDMWINPENPDLFIQGNDGGANVTHNGGETWSTQFNQPTAELYQVEVDDQYPYWLYAGQQDNWSTIAVPSRAPWGVQSVDALLIETGGCETGPAVPKPGDHNTVYANCKGRFGVFDKRTGTERSFYVGAANMYGENPADLRYRFQRVAPVHVSPHDPGTVYHASQYVHRTRDEGRTWETISPDLTAFESDKQVIYGSPITRDITGEEFYSTIYSLRESPLEPGLIWVGANDGPVHVTRDGGDSWQDVTPRRLPGGGRVDSVEPSHHDPAVAYIAVHRYLLGDWKPYIYRTDNYGRSWQLLSGPESGIPQDHPVRVVREDPQRPGLLFAGTEYGVFLSADDGGSWQPLQQNLPVTPVTDIRIHRGDLALSTMGRGFWIMDQVAVLRNDAALRGAEEAALLPPAPAIRYRQRVRGLDSDDVPQYPPPAAIIDYYLPQLPQAPITLEIRDRDGGLVNAFRSAEEGEETAGETAMEQVVEDMGLSEVIYLSRDTLTTDPGLNRFRWDMRHRGAWREDEGKRFSGGPLAAPGQYTVRLGVNGETYEQTLLLKTDPRVLQGPVSEADIEATLALELSVQALLDRARRAAHALQASLKAADNAPADAAARQAALDALETAEGTYMPPGLINQIAYLGRMLAGADQAPGADAIARYEELAAVLEATLSGLAL